MVNIRAKGQNGEREIADELNAIVRKVLTDLGYTKEQIDAKGQIVQRNQNQSAVGGSDLSNTFGLAIEVKRQETLSINTWWKQCTTAAEKNGGDVPVLLYRQNRCAWKCRMPVQLVVKQLRVIQSVGEISFDDFKFFFYHWVRTKLESGIDIERDS